MCSFSGHLLGAVLYELSAFSLAVTLAGSLTITPTQNGNNPHNGQDERIWGGKNTIGEKRAVHHRILGGISLGNWVHADALVA